MRSREDWQFQIEKDHKSCKGLLGGTCMISKGRVLGGTSTINNLLYIRGTYEDYEKNEFEYWNGNVSYQIFHHIEKLQGNSCSICHFGKSGLIPLEILNYTDWTKDILIEAYMNSGYRRMPRRASIGFLERPLLIKSGERFNMAKAFLTPIKDRSNFYFTKNTEVQAVSIPDNTDRRADGVNISIDGANFFIRARKEVILTAGAINNAKLLLLSGVGEKKYLLSRKIPVHSDLPAVGKNLQFHLTLPVFIAIEPKGEHSYYSEIDLFTDTADYVLTRGGNLSHTNINNFVNYINTAKKGICSPSLAIYHMLFKIGDRNLMAWVDAMNYHPKIINALLKYNRDKVLILFLITLLYSRSRGEILLNETHYLSNPIIKGNFMSDEIDHDYDSLLSGFVYITNLTDFMPKQGADFVNLDLPDCRNYKFCSTTYVKCYIQNMAYPNHDVIGTAKMGPECDNSAVVKETLEVRKLRCLRVADSSVLNNMPIGGTVATDAMIGYRLGEIMKEKWLKDYVSPFHNID